MNLKSDLMAKRLNLLFLFFALTASTLAAANNPADLGKDIDIPYTRFVLKNGLTVVVHEDHKAPIVAIDV